MPRLPPSLLNQAHNVSPNVRALLPTCRDLRSAHNELRWIREHVASTPSFREGEAQAVPHEQQQQRIARLCARRGRGEPLQYVLGTQPFGRLDMKCRPGVLIPRPETEAYVHHLAALLRRGELGAGGTERKTQAQALRVLDFCTGTGCIALGLYSLLHARFPGMRVQGLDISESAVALARENLGHNVRRGLLPASAVEEGPRFGKADIFSDDWRAYVEEGEGVDVLVSNPPYISTRGFNRDTGRSVRNHEPKLALVPDAAVSGEAECMPEDVFYSRLFEIAETWGPRVMLFEVGDLNQALRVAEMATKLQDADHMRVEIWRDWPDMSPEEHEIAEARVKGTTVQISGSGNGRSVLVHRRR
ncbi:HemK family methyltransferase [Xylariales sp. AK1849]|nr:HemK family methyltransferase [Xylariales sp. AK1849]